MTVPLRGFFVSIFGKIIFLAFWLNRLYINDILKNQVRFWCDFGAIFAKIRAGKSKNYSTCLAKIAFFAQNRRKSHPFALPKDLIDNKLDHFCEFANFPSVFIFYR